MRRAVCQAVRLHACVTDAALRSVSDSACAYAVCPPAADASWALHSISSLASLQSSIPWSSSRESATTHALHPRVEQACAAGHCSIHQSFSSSAVQKAEAATADSEPAQHDFPVQYSRVDRVTAPFRISPKKVFAVVEAGPAQFKVSPNDLIVTEKLRGLDVNDKFNFERVLLLGSQYQTIIGRPFVPGATVTAVVEEQFQDAKVITFKKRRRKHSRRTMGHRQELTTVRILDICGIEEVPADAALQEAA